MKGEELSMQVAENEPPLVEDVWEDVFVDFGFEREQAERMTQLIFAKPELTMTVQPPDEIYSIVRQELDDLDFESEIGGQSDKLRAVLREVLQQGLDGLLLGPGVAPPDTAHASTESRGKAFDAVRQSFREVNVSPNVIDFSELPTEENSSDEGANAANSDVEAPGGPLDGENSGPSSPSTNHYTPNRAHAQDLFESGRTGDDVGMTETEEILEFIDYAARDDSPVVREQAMTSIARLATVPEIRSDHQIEKLVGAYQKEPDSSVRAAIVAGLEDYVYETSQADESDSGTGSNDDSESGSDPRNAFTGEFSNDNE
ncbi:HEAT repeat domain-containing protein [Natronoglomus mannanivorans]|uniref:HEAT repeat-containing protein n=1 Tax=Natronoglomus mannanivorans TaxID=2979990 RepID=A0AAP2Z458_9EURY|nr:hypothetical protein [Halobacteria archaeon AArc-xg1-1]